jgi:hypothetical protein
VHNELDLSTIESLRHLEGSSTRTGARVRRVLPLLVTLTSSQCRYLEASFLRGFGQAIKQPLSSKLFGIFSLGLSRLDCKPNAREFIANFEIHRTALSSLPAQLLKIKQFAPTARWLHGAVGPGTVSVTSVSRVLFLHANQGT